MHTRSRALCGGDETSAFSFSGTQHVLWDRVLPCLNAMYDWSSSEPGVTLVSLPGSVHRGAYLHTTLRLDPHCHQPVFTL